MARSLALMGVIAISFLAAPAVQAGGFEVGITIHGADDSKLLDGQLYVFDGRMRGFSGDPRDVASASMRPSGGATAVSSSSMVGVASDATTAGKVDVKVGSRNANAFAEVIYDVEANKRIEVDHIGKTYSAKDLVLRLNNPADAILGQAPGAVSKRDQGALRGMMEAFTKPRLDPKRALSLEPMSLTKQVVIGSQKVSCDWFEIHQMGGAIGTACLSDPKSVPNGVAFLAKLHSLPLAGSGSNDIIGRVRRISDTGKLPVILTTGGPAPDLPVTVTYRIMSIDEAITFESAPLGSYAEN